VPAGGPLPADLLSLATQNISLAGNQFNGSLPTNWSSSTILALDLSNNKLSGTLPPAWGNTAMPTLAQLLLQGNRLQGGWAGGRAAQGTRAARCSGE